MDSNKDMYIIVAEKKDNSSEMLLNVYDLSGNVASCGKNRTDFEIKQENEDGILNEHNLTHVDPFHIKQELNEAKQKMQLDIIKKEFMTAINKEPTTKNELEYFIEVDTEEHKFEEFDLQVKYQEEQLANTYWSKLRKILKEQGFVVHNKKELLTVLSMKCVKKLCSPGNEKGDKIIKNIARLMKQQLPSPEINTSTYFLNENGYFQCVVCSSEELSEVLIQEHYTTTHGPRHLCCLACDSPCRTKSHLYKHEGACGWLLAPLVRAARRLERQKPGPFPRSFNLVCHVCGKMVRRNNMDIHLMSHATQNMYFCSLCTASFRRPESCEAHERAHNGLRPYKCTQCPRAYTSHTSLQTHKETHRVAGFTCDICKRRFNRKYTLIPHMATHMGKKNYTCKQCGKILSSQVSLRNHMKKHTGGSALHKCTKCNKKYPAMYTLRAHMKKIHGTDIVTRKMFFNILPTMGTALHTELFSNKACDYIEVKRN